jgi:predicted ferric reductase
MLAMTFLWAFSVLPIRQRWYEAFLIGHIVFSIITIVGCWYHVWTLYGSLWGFEIWVYVCIAAWVADRTLRVGRIAKWGRKHATITAIDDDYIQIDIPDVAMEGHAFLYFPSLSWKAWENHPFSIARSIYVTSHQADDSSSQTPASESEVSQDYEKYPVAKATTLRSADGTASRQLTFVIRVVKGTTAKLAARAGQTIPVYIEGGYSKVHGTDLHTHVVAIAGGTGITAVLPILRKHPGRAKLYWGVRNERLVNHLRASGLLDGIEIAQVSVGARLDIASIVETEIDGRIKDPVVVVSGPASMADDVRASTVNVVRKTGVNVKFLDEAFSW